MPTNTAAWLGAKGAKLAVKPAPYTHPHENEIVVKNHAVAINPLDWIIQVAGSIAYRWIKYPFILGADLAGEVVEVGTAVTRFKVGDRVLGHAVGTDNDRNSPAEGAFQEYTVLLAQMAAPIPGTMPYASAAVLPLGLSTAACGLFQKDLRRCTIPLRPRNRPAKRCSSGAARRASAAMPSNSLSPPATRSSRRPRHEISTVYARSAQARFSATTARPSCKRSSRPVGGSCSPVRSPLAQGLPSPVRRSSTPAPATSSSP